MSCARAVLVAVVLLTWGCGDLLEPDEPATATTLDLPAAPATSVDPTAAPTTSERRTSVADRDEAVRTIQAFWQEKGPDIGLDEFRPLADERVVAIEDRSDLVACDGERLPMGVIEDNAMAVPCAEGHTVLFDTSLFEALTARFGPAAPAVVLAHEWGHVAQFQAGITSAPVIVEQQADCFAGAWVAWAGRNGIAPFHLPSTLDSVLAAVVDFRDEPGVSPADSQAHGSGFDRVRAFQEGFERDVVFCATYPDAPPSLVQLPFQPDELATGGNLPLVDAVELMSADLDRFFGGLVDGFEPVDPLSVASPDELTAAHGEIGDNGVGLLLALGWSSVAQELTGAQTDGDGPQLQRACLAGAWMGELLEPPPGAEIRLSPGDLDEAIITFLEQRGQAGSTDGVLVFEMVASLRLGVTDGPDACRL